MRSLPERAQQVFLRLCRMEEDDRYTFFFPDSGDQLAVLAEHGVVETDGQRLLVDPAAAELGRAAIDSELARSVDEGMAANWTASMVVARDNGQVGEVVSLALKAAPYLRRLERWDQLAWVCETALARDTSPSTAALLLPFAEAAAKGGLGERALHARVLIEVDRERGLAQSREVLAAAVAAGDFRLAAATASELSNVLRAAGSPEASTLARQASEYTASAGLGPWSRALARLRELQALPADRAVLDEVRRLLAELPATSGEPETTTLWHVREGLLNLGSYVGATVGDGLHFAEELVASMTSRNATLPDLAKARFVLADRLVDAGRDTEAREHLLWCQSVSDDGAVSGVLAGIEDRAGNHSRAAELKADALRAAYAAGNLTAIGEGHHDLAVLLGRLDSASPRVLANYVASAVIAFRMQAGTLATEIDMLAMFTFAHGLPPQIALEDMIALAEQTEGVHLGDLLERLPQQAPDELQQVFDAVLQRAGQTMQDWTPLMSAVVLKASGDEQPGLDEHLRAWLTDLDQRAGTEPLLHALHRVLAGERGPELLAGLGMLPTGIVSKILGALSERERGGSAPAS
uniref:hypothetical protein n=1 Tax=Lentzea alba TaxID=2714351 RepID=UPI0039BFBAFD